MANTNTHIKLEKSIGRYQNYKDSGVEWLGEIPEHWELIRFKFLAVANKGKLPNKIVSLNEGSLPPYMSMEYLRGGEENQWVKDQDAIIIDEDEILLLWDGSNAGEFLKSRNGVISSTVAHIVFKNINKKFAWFYSKILELELRKNTVGMGIPHVNGKVLNNLLITLPPIAEQTTIAQFLDDKTTKIDEAIAIKEQQINLLKERKQILIHKAVTRGLDDNVTLKDSGVEWIGEIPAHWEVKKLKYILNEKLKYGANESGIEYDINLPRYVRITDFGMDGKLNEESKLSLSWKNGGDYLLKDGDILFARSGATVGKTYQFKKSMSIEKDYCFAGYLIKAEANEEIILSDFLYLYTNSELFNKWKDSIFIKATIENIGADKYSQLYVNIPPIKEQKEILLKYQKDSKKIETTITLKQQEIGKIKEYKSSLINSVVTGKVKVC